MGNLGPRGADVNTLLNAAFPLLAGQVSGATMGNLGSRVDLPGVQLGSDVTPDSRVNVNSLVSSDEEDASSDEDANDDSAVAASVRKVGDGRMSSDEDAGLETEVPEPNSQSPQREVPSDGIFELSPAQRKRMNKKIRKEEVKKLKAVVGAIVSKGPSTDKYTIDESPLKRNEGSTCFHGRKKKNCKECTPKKVSGGARSL